MKVHELLEILDRIKCTAEAVHGGTVTGAMGVPVGMTSADFYSRHAGSHIASRVVETVARIKAEGLES